MIVQHRPPLHLTYCLNIHPGESWAENLAALREKTTAVKQRVAPEAWFGAGLRLAHRAAEELTASEEARREAHRMIRIVSTWRSVARTMGLSHREIEAMAPAVATTESSAARMNVRC